MYILKSKVQAHIRREISPLYLKCLLKCFGKKICDSGFWIHLGGPQWKRTGTCFHYCYCTVKLLVFQRLLYVI